MEKILSVSVTYPDELSAYTKSIQIPQTKRRALDCSHAS